MLYYSHIASSKLYSSSIFYTSFNFIKLKSNFIYFNIFAWLIATDYFNELLIILYELS